MVWGDTLLDFPGLYQGSRHWQDRAAGGLLQGGAPDTCPVHSSLPTQASMVPNSKLMTSRQRGQGSNEKVLDFNTFQDSPPPLLFHSGAPHFHCMLRLPNNMADPELLLYHEQLAQCRYSRSVNKGHLLHCTVRNRSKQQGRLSRYSTEDKIKRRWSQHSLKSGPNLLHVPNTRDVSECLLSTHEYKMIIQFHEQFVKTGVSFVITTFKADVQIH